MQHRVRPPGPAVPPSAVGRRPDNVVGGGSVVLDDVERRLGEGHAVGAHRHAEEVGGGVRRAGAAVVQHGPGVLDHRSVEVDASLPGVLLPQHRAHLARGVLNKREAGDRVDDARGVQHQLGRVGQDAVRGAGDRQDRAQNPHQRHRRQHCRGYVRAQPGNCVHRPGYFLVVGFYTFTYM